MRFCKLRSANKKNQEQPSQLLKTFVQQKLRKVNDQKHDKMESNCYNDHPLRII